MPPKRARSTATAAPTRRSTRAATAASASASVGKKRTHSPDHNDDEVDGEDDELPKAPPKKRAKSSKAPKIATNDDDDAEEAENDNLKTTVKTTAKRVTRASTQKSLAKGVKAKPGDEDVGVTDGGARSGGKGNKKKDGANGSNKRAGGAPKAKSPSPPAKMVTVIKRGAAPVDPNSSHVDTHLVYEANGEVWDAMLNQVCNGLPRFACSHISGVWACAKLTVLYITIGVDNFRRMLCRTTTSTFYFHIYFVFPDIFCNKQHLHSLHLYAQVLCHPTFISD